MEYQPVITQSTKNGASCSTIKIWQQIPFGVTSTNSDIATVSWDRFGDSDIDELIRKLQKRMNIVPTVEHKCHNCGGVLEMRADQHIFVCPYCGTAYAIGTLQLNDRG